MNTRPPAVVIGPPDAGVPVGFTPFAVSSSNSPSGTRQAISPVFALTATSSPHGGSVQLHMLALFQKRLNGLGVFVYRSGAPVLTAAGAGAAAAPASWRPPPAPRKPPPGARRPHCPAVCTLPMIRPSALLYVTPHQLLPPCAPGNSRMF